MWEGAGDRTELQHIDPHSIGHNCVSFPFSRAAQPGALGPSLSLGHVPQSSIFSPTHLISNWSNFQCTDLYNIVGVTNCTHSTHPRSSLYSAKLRPDAPVIYTSIFPILTARPGRRSIYNTISTTQYRAFLAKSRIEFKFLSYFDHLIETF